MATQILATSKRFVMLLSLALSIVLITGSLNAQVVIPQQPYINSSGKTVGPVTTAGTALDSTLGAEQITATADRDFSSDTGKWTGTNWTIGGGVATHTAGANAFTLDNTALAVAPVAGSLYQIIYTANTTTAGTLTPSIGSTSGIAMGQAVETQTGIAQLILASGTGALTFTPNAAWAGTLDNISVKIITPLAATYNLTNPDGTISYQERNGGGSSQLNTNLGYLSNQAQNPFTKANVFVGYQAGQYNVDTSGINNTNGSNNTYVGYTAGANNTQGVSNTYIGQRAGASSINSNSNTFIGAQSGDNNTTGGGNSGVGRATMFFITSGTNNVAFGNTTLSNITTGSNNTAIGNNTGKGITTGSNNTVLGATVTGLSPTLANNVIIADGSGNIRAQHDGTNWIITNGFGALTHALPADQTGNATATFKMNGLGAAAAPCTITPVLSGRVQFFITGDQAQNTTADGVTFKLAFGTGTAPANAAAASGTVISATQSWTGLTGSLQQSFAIQSITTGLALGTAVWYDLQIADVTGGTASVKNIDCTAHEM